MIQKIFMNMNITTTIANIMSMNIMTTIMHTRILLTKIMSITGTATLAGTISAAHR